MRSVIISPIILRLRAREWFRCYYANAYTHCLGVISNRFVATIRSSAISALHQASTDFAIFSAVSDGLAIFCNSVSFPNSERDSADNQGEIIAFENGEFRIRFIFKEYCDWELGNFRRVFPYGLGRRPLVSELVNQWTITGNNSPGRFMLYIFPIDPSTHTGEATGR